MIHSYSVALTQLVKEFNLRPIHKATDYEQINITVDDISRPGLQLAGYFDHFEPMRLQVIGTVETTYLNKLSADERRSIFDRYFSYKIPALIISRDLDPLPECLAEGLSGAPHHPSRRPGGGLRRGPAAAGRERHR